MPYYSCDSHVVEPAEVFEGFEPRLRGPGACCADE